MACCIHVFALSPDLITPIFMARNAPLKAEKQGRREENLARNILGYTRRIYARAIPGSKADN
jgi:hypothetical protein